MDKTEIGKVGWIDISVDDATGLRDFYATVTGWQPESAPMGDYDDFIMNTPHGASATAGICHARAGNANMPGQWLIYITVEDVDASARACKEQGGKLIVEPKSMGGARFCVIEDPAGAVAGLYQPG